MTQTALGIGVLLVLIILAGGASCWTIAFLKVLAGSPRLPQGLTDAAAQLHVTLGYRPSLPLVDWSPRRPVPWGLVDLAGTLVLYFLGIIAIRVVLGQLDWLPKVEGELDDAQLPLADKAILVWANMAVSVGLLVVAGALIALRTGATWRDFGLSARELWSDVKLGAAGFVMLAPPVYALQGLLVYFWKPSKHPLMEMFKESPDATFFAVLFVAAAVVAPIFEELVFRVLLQGFLEKMFSFTGPVHELVLGSTGNRSSTVMPLMGGSLPEGKQPAEDIVFLSDQPVGSDNPYAPPAAVGEFAAPNGLVYEEKQAELRGAAAWLPIAISSLIFALLHWDHGPDWVALSLLAAGMGYLYQRTHRLVPSLVVHALINSLSMFGLWLQVFALPDQGS